LTVDKTSLQLLKKLITRFFLNHGKEENTLDVFLVFLVFVRRVLFLLLPIVWIVLPISAGLLTPIWGRNDRSG
jgi:hypothetical protein